MALRGREVGVCSPMDDGTEIDGDFFAVEWDRCLSTLLFVEARNICSLVSLGIVGCHYGLGSL